MLAPNSAKGQKASRGTRNAKFQASEKEKRLAFTIWRKGHYVAGKGAGGRKKEIISA